MHDIAFIFHHHTLRSTFNSPIRKPAANACRAFQRAILHNQDRDMVWIPAVKGNTGEIPSRLGHFSRHAPFDRTAALSSWLIA